MPKRDLKPVYKLKDVCPDIFASNGGSRYLGRFRVPGLLGYRSRRPNLSRGVDAYIVDGKYKRLVVVQAIDNEVKNKTYLQLMECEVPDGPGMGLDEVEELFEPYTGV